MISGIFEYSDAHPLARTALDYRSLRQDLIASNLSNVDTPMYRPKDIRFEEMMAERAKEALGDKDPKNLELAKTHGYHLDPPTGVDGVPAIFFRDGHMARNDGNSVDLDVEMGEMAKNGMMYNALINGLKKHSQIFRAALDASGKLQ